MLALALFSLPTAICLPTGAGAEATGEIATLAAGRYACELPGDATGPVGRRMPDQDFTILSASGYRARGSGGAYLRIGDTVTMTTGPFRGQRYRRISDRLLRALTQEGQVSPLRCIRHRSQ